MIDPKTEMMKPEQVAKLLNVTTETLRKWRKTGDGPPFIGITERTFRYPRPSLDAWMFGKELENAEIVASSESD